MPQADPTFVKELKKIDSDLRVVWGYDRYFLNRWVIERRIPPERYRLLYASLLAEGGPRFVQQPIFDTGKPIFADTLDVDGNPILQGYTLIGYREFDLMPDYEWVMTVENQDGTYRPIGFGGGNETLTALRRTYAWERGHSLTRLRLEKQNAREEQEQKLSKQRAEENLDEILEHKRELWNLPFSGQPAQIMDGTAVD